ncbi:hypothetical protein KZ829_00365 [Actinoplanes hulinensis]|uniref:Uncharacterized protein n=1 Tax=Actinoplanes hulinensis TaxID=1144547 RepID=A0ABS7AU75_9ACTN|nr:hypothetical protein [Actinoplanes hulinensis]MBW6432199.1 hypothetical protein [Actinoplanes hulinensis]
MSRRPKDPQTKQLMATIDSESRPYTDRAAKYPRARQYQQARDEGVTRRR